MTAEINEVSEFPAPFLETADIKSEAFMLKHFHSSLLKQQCEALRLLEAANESGTIGCWMFLTVTVCISHEAVSSPRASHPSIVHVNSYLPQSLSPPLLSASPLGSRQL